MKIINPERADMAAVVEDARELRLIGRANLDFWNARLAGRPFRPFAVDGAAEIVIGATALVWKGFGFNELTISLAVADRNDPTAQSGYYLLHAFNSNRFFAFCERFFFSTPYLFGRVELRETAPLLIDARAAGETGLRAETAGAAARGGAAEDETWEGAVFLPVAGDEKYFIAKLSGETKIYPFAATDRLEFRSADPDDVFARLADSGFAGREWRARSRAFHAKSKTYRLNREAG